MRYADNVDDEQTLDDLRILKSALHTKQFRNALKVIPKLFVVVHVCSKWLCLSFVLFV